MNTSSYFEEYYKTISDTELLIIIENPTDYQSLAVEAAKKEFASRKLSDAAIQEARQPVLEKQCQKKKQQDKIKIIENKLKNSGAILFDTLNPVQQGIPTAEKIIRFIIIIYAGLFLYEMITSYGEFIAAIKDLSKFPIESALFIFLFLLMPAAVIPFWKRRSVGWTLLTIYLVFTIVAILWVAFLSFNWKPSGLGELDKLFPRPSYLNLILQLIFPLATLLVICKKNIRDIYFIKEQEMVATIAISGLLALFCVYAIS
ncbi:MAG: hypothetical protein ABIR30_01185 [Chitinophagaceae bacterium]